MNVETAQVVRPPTFMKFQQSRALSTVRYVGRAIFGGQSELKLSTKIIQEGENLAVRIKRQRICWMRIAEVAPLAESVPPKLYGGTERVVSWLTEALLDLNCSVTLFASGDSSTRARLVAVCPRALRLAKPPTDPALATSALIEAVAEKADEFDLIHWHTDWLHLPLTP